MYTPLNVSFLKTLFVNLSFSLQILTSRKEKELLFSVSNENLIFLRLLFMYLTNRETCSGTSFMIISIIVIITVSRRLVKTYGASVKVSFNMNLAHFNITLHFWIILFKKVQIWFLNGLLYFYWRLQYLNFVVKILKV